MRHLVYIAAVLALVGCSEAPAEEEIEENVPAKETPTLGGKADGFEAGGLPYSATSTVEALKGDLGSMDPAVGGNSKLYLRPMSALGYYGPTGPYGPLGLLGPVGDGVWSPSRYVSGDLSWHVWSDMVDAAEGPLGPDGPLGHKGPLNPDEWVTLGAAEDAPVYDDGFLTHLGPGGVFAVLGPAGPLGALGPLGPLGPWARTASRPTPRAATWTPRARCSARWTWSGRPAATCALTACSSTTPRTWPRS